MPSFNDRSLENDEIVLNLGGITFTPNLTTEDRVSFTDKQMETNRQIDELKREINGLTKKMNENNEVNNCNVKSRKNLR